MCKILTLKSYRRVRAIRDEILTCDNLGRQKYLLKNFINVYKLSVSKSNNRIVYAEITTLDHYTYSRYGENALKYLAQMAYLIWIKEQLK